MLHLRVPADFEAVDLFGMWTSSFRSYSSHDVPRVIVVVVVIVHEHTPNQMGFAGPKCVRGMIVMAS